MGLDRRYWEWKRLGCEEGGGGGGMGGGVEGEVPFLSSYHLLSL